MFSIRNIKAYYHNVMYEKHIRDNERKTLLEEANCYFNEGVSPKQGNINDYKNALYHHRFSIGEYKKYKLASLTKEQRDDVISCFEMNSIYRKFVHDSVRKVFADKARCLKIFNKWVRREWCLVRETSYEDFVNLVSSTDCIAKPMNGECGRGIFKIKKDDKQDLFSLYEQCVKNDMLVEECVYACDEIEQFHPASLNTIRVVTMSNGTDSVIVGAALRIGAGGSIIDNVAGGGVSVPICMKNGEIQENAMDANGCEYEKHPDTNIVFKGTRIPNWNKVEEMCREASTIVKDAVFTGWDICVLPSGEVELIEANAMPDIGVVQFATSNSKKSIIKKAGMDLLNMNLLKLTSIWSRSYRKLEK